MRLIAAPTMRSINERRLSKRKKPSLAKLSTELSTLRK